jgi:hypothetical protein
VCSTRTVHSATYVLPGFLTCQAASCGLSRSRLAIRASNNTNSTSAHGSLGHTLVCCLVALPQGDAELFAIPQPAACSHQHQHTVQQQQAQQHCQPDHHNMLGFSFPTIGSSSVMSLEGQTFRQLQLAGLSDNEASLLMTTAPGGWLVQVSTLSCHAPSCLHLWVQHVLQTHAAVLLDCC